jgi:hypothetical protein
MKICAALLFLFNALNTSAQTYFVRDSFTGEAIPFVKVRPSTGDPFLADIDGAIHFTYVPETVDLRAGGYRDTNISLTDIKDSILLLTPFIQTIQEVRAVAGENPAHRIINLAIANRKKNNPLENDAFRYESYSKFIFDVIFKRHKQSDSRKLFGTTTHPDPRKCLHPYLHPSIARQGGNHRLQSIRV